VFHTEQISVASSVITCLFGALSAFGTERGPAEGLTHLLLPPPEDVLRGWNDIGGKLIDVAQDIPTDKCNFKVRDQSEIKRPVHT
jgi:hypothetical protein